jgi:hypothetical protein
VYGTGNTMNIEKLENILKDFNSLYCIENGLSDRQIVHGVTEYYSPDLYTYKYNSHGFRSTEFSSDVDILTAGCSHTFGSSIPFEHTWSQQLQKKIPNKKIATIAGPGYSTQKIISYIFRYFENIGNPKMIICNFPDFYRFLFLNNFSNRIVHHYKNMLETPTLDKKTKKELKSSSPAINWGYYINYEYIFMLEKYCDSNNIKLIWSTWSNDEAFDHDNNNIFHEIGLNNVHESLKNTFKHYHEDHENVIFDNMSTSISFDKNKKIQYSERTPESLLHCHREEKNETEDFFEIAYDRYIVPEKDRNDIQKHLKMSRLEKDKNLKQKLEDPNHNGGHRAHFGSHRNIHWAEFYYDIIKEKYPEFTI